MNPAFATGLANSITGGLEQANQSKLQLAMLSKRLELESQNRINEQKQLQQVTGLSPEQMGGLTSLITGKEVGPGQIQNLKDIFPEGNVPGHVIGPAFQAMGMGQRANMYLNKPTSHVATDPQTGAQTLITLNPETGQVLSKTPMGYSQEAGKKIQAAHAGYMEAKGILGNVQDTLSPILAKSASGIPEQYVGLKLNQIAQYEPSVKAYFDAMPATTQRLGVALTNAIGADRSPQFLQKQSKELPQMTDDLPTALEKIKRMNFLFKNRMGSEFQSRGIPVPQETNEPVQQPQPGQGGNTPDPYAGLSLEEKMDILNGRRTNAKPKQPAKR